MKAIFTNCACHSSIVRITIHLVAFATGREGVTRAVDGIMREFHISLM